MQRTIGLGGCSGVGLTEGARRPKGRPGFAPVIFAGALIFGTLALTNFAMDPVPGRAVDTGTPWAAHIQRMDGALARKDVGAAEQAWHAAYLAALASRRWEGRAAVGDAYLRIGQVAGARKTAEAKARTSYLAALFYARQQGSLEGVLRVAEAFAALGDREVAEGCLRMADALAADARDPQARDRVRAYRERLATRFLEAHGAP